MWRHTVHLAISLVSTKVFTRALDQSQVFSEVLYFCAGSKLEIYGLISKHFTSKSWFYWNGFAEKIPRAFLLRLKYVNGKLINMRMMLILQTKLTVGCCQILHKRHLLVVFYVHKGTVFLQAHVTRFMTRFIIIEEFKAGTARSMILPPSIVTRIWMAKNCGVSLSNCARMRE